MQDTEGVEDFIIKLVELGFFSISIENLKSNTLTQNIEIASMIAKKIQCLRDFVIIKDYGCLIDGRTPIWWFQKILNGLIPGLTFGIASTFNITPNRFKEYKQDYFCANLQELSESDRLGFLREYASKKNISLNNEDRIYFKKCLTGFPPQISFCVDIIEENENGLAFLKKNTDLISGFNKNIATKLLDLASKTIKDKTITKDDIMQYLSFICKMPNAPVKIILEVNDLNPKYKMIYYHLLSLNICTLKGSTKEIVSISNIVFDYIDRTYRDQIPKDIENYLFNNIKDFNKQTSWDSYELAELNYYIKVNLTEDNSIMKYHFVYPSVILKTVIDLFNKKNFERVIELCKEVVDKTANWDIYLIRKFEFNLCRSYACLGKREIFDEIMKKQENTNNYILEEADRHFLKGLYYRQQYKYDMAFQELESAMKINPNHMYAANAIVHTYLAIDDFDRASTYAKSNYNKFPYNPYNIRNYFSCLVRFDPPNKELLERLINEVEKVTGPTIKHFPIEMRALYAEYVEHDLKKAGEMISENKLLFNDAIYFHKLLFDIYEAQKDIINMEIQLNRIKQLVDSELVTYYPVYARRKAIFDIYNLKDKTMVISDINADIKLSESIKLQIIKKVESFFKGTKLKIFTKDFLN